MKPQETRQYWHWSSNTRGAHATPEARREAHTAIIKRIKNKTYTAIDVYLELLGDEFSNEQLGQIIVLIQADLLFASWDTADAKIAEAFLAACRVTLRESQGQ